MLKIWVGINVNELLQLHVINKKEHLRIAYQIIDYTIKLSIYEWVYKGAFLLLTYHLLLNFLSQEIGIYSLRRGRKFIPQYFEGKTILITGATGFLAKILLEKILRVHPNVNKVYLLMRSNDKRNVEQRLQEEVVGTRLFEVVRNLRGNAFCSSKLIPVSGDVAYENLGIVDEEVRQQMWREIHIIVNSAATTKFDDRYDISFGINALGAMHIQDFASKCSKLETLLHVSTAYVHGARVGVAPEQPLRMGQTLPGAKIPILDINLEKDIIEERLRFLQSQKLSDKEITRSMKDLGVERAMLHGWPNTYVFTKAMGEMMLEGCKGKCKVIIIRPTIITSTFKDPFPGWIEGVRTLDSIFVGYGKGKLKFFVGDPETISDLIPGDMVINCMIAAMAVNSSDKQQDLFVYQIGSSRRNPAKYEEIKWIMHRYLSKNPFLDDGGKPITVGYPFTLNSMASFHNYISLRYSLFLLILRLINLISGNYFESLYTNAKRRINHALRLAELYRPYLFSQGIFDDSNTENLRMRLRGSNADMEMLNFDPKCIMWDDYLYNTEYSNMH